MEEKETKYDPTMDQLKHQQAVDRAALSMAQERESIMMDNYNKAQYEDVAQIVSEAETKLAEAKQKDEVAQKRSNAFRYIAGLGDTLSGIANVIGTAHGAANQQQTYNGNMVAEKAEQARKERKIELDQLSTRLDEMKARERELKAAGSLADAQLKAKQGREQLTLKQQQDAQARETKWNLQQQAWKEEEAARAQENWQKTFDAQQAQNKQTQENWQKTYDMQYAKFKEEQKENKYNFTLANESIDIPKEKLNEVNVERIYNMLPSTVKANIKGEQYTEIIPGEDEFSEPIKKTSYKAPSLAQKLAAIGAYADANDNVKRELLKLAGKDVSDYPVQQPLHYVPTGKRKPGENITGTQSYKPNELSNEQALNHFKKYLRK